LREKTFWGEKGGGGEVVRPSKQWGVLGGYSQLEKKGTIDGERGNYLGRRVGLSRKKKADSQLAKGKKGLSASKASIQRGAML